MTFIKTIFLSLCILASTLMSSAQVKFSIDPRLGMTLSGGQLLKEYRGHQFQLPTSKSYDIQLDYSLGILANVGDRWASSFRVGKYGTGLGYNHWETSQNRSGYYIGFDLNYFKLHTEYTWSRLQIKNGILKHWGVNMQGEIALGYDYVPSVQVSDEPREYSMMRLGGGSYYTIERSIQTKRGQGSLSLGLNGQITYKGKRHLKIGALFNYVPSNAVYFDVTYYENRTDEIIDYFQSYGSKYWMTFYASYPIPLFTLKERNKR